jgi:aspartyl-tRNA synthetase
MLRTHTCGELRKKHKGKDVTLCGWVDTIRTHGSLTFIDLRDRYGKTQIVLNKQYPIKKEYVLQIKGKVVIKSEPNKALKTGDIEIKANKLKILNKSKALPIDDNATDEARLKYRYLDLRDPKKLKYLEFRNQVYNHVRNYFYRHKFIEIDTPMLVKPTPEGARDYVVPSRVNKHKFYSLPQSPQLYKQILMISGIDKYFQAAKCLRDEDLRADRQPEHTQFDFEMSFVTSDQIREFVESLMISLFKEVLNIKLSNFPVLSYEESMEEYGIDKPDLRFDMKLIDFNNLASNSSFKIFKEAEYVKGIFAEKDFSRKEIGKLTQLVKIYKAKGLAYMKVEKGKLDSGISKFFNEKEQNQILSKLPKKNGTVFFIADNKKICLTALGQLRNELGNILNLKNNKEFKFCWIKDFPLFSYNEEEKKWEPEHHMFSMPKQEFIDDFEKRPGEVKGDLWDLVLNGIEMASGSVRISNPELQERILKFVGFDKQEAKKRFGFLLRAYEYGGPIHGGMGIGADRLIAMMLGLKDIREVIAFPKNKNAQCPMDGSPSTITKQQLNELHIKLK